MVHILVYSIPDKVKSGIIFLILSNLILINPYLDMIAPNNNNNNNNNNKDNNKTILKLKLFLHITTTCLFKYTENFTTKKWKFSDKKFWYF